MAVQGLVFPCVNKEAYIVCILLSPQTTYVRPICENKGIEKRRGKKEKNRSSMISLGAAQSPPGKKSRFPGQIQQHPNATDGFQDHWQPKV